MEISVQDLVVFHFWEQIKDLLGRGWFCSSHGFWLDINNMSCCCRRWIFRRWLIVMSFRRSMRRWEGWWWWRRRRKIGTGTRRVIHLCRIMMLGHLLGQVGRVVINGCVIGTIVTRRFWNFWQTKNEFKLHRLSLRAFEGRLCPREIRGMYFKVRRESSFSFHIAWPRPCSKKAY